MRKKLVAPALLLAGLFLGFGTNPDTAFSAPADDVDDVVNSANVCGLVQDVKTAENGTLELSVTIFVAGEDAMPVSTGAVGTYRCESGEASCAEKIRPNAFMCFDFTRRDDTYWISNCVAPF